MSKSLRDTIYYGDSGDENDARQQSINRLYGFISRNAQEEEIEDFLLREH